MTSMALRAGGGRGGALSGVSEPVKHRVAAIQHLLDALSEAKHKQDAIPGSTGRGVWITYGVWAAIYKQLKLQAAELVQWEAVLTASQQELGLAQGAIQTLEETVREARQLGQDQASRLQQRINTLEADAAEQRQAWQQQQAELCSQADSLLGNLSAKKGTERELGDRLQEVAHQLADATARQQEATARAADSSRRAAYYQARAAELERQRDKGVVAAREAGLQLEDARRQLDAHRTALAARREPSQELLTECRGLRDDNRRLVALLGSTKEWRELAARVAEQEGSLRYLPIHEVLQYKGGVVGVYPALDDRPVPPPPKPGAFGSAEDWAWVPREALDAVRDTAMRVLPAGPLEPLLGMLLALNKIWRQREVAALSKQRAAAEEEMRELHRLYRQRAPYEAAVGRTRLSELKRQLRLQADAADALAARASGNSRTASENSKVLLALGLESVNTLSSQVKALSKRTGRLRRKLADKAARPPVCTSCLDALLMQGGPQTATPPAAPAAVLNVWDLLPGPNPNPGSAPSPAPPASSTLPVSHPSSPTHHSTRPTSSRPGSRGGAADVAPLPAAELTFRIAAQQAGAAPPEPEASAPLAVSRKSAAAQPAVTARPQPERSVTDLPPRKGQPTAANRVAKLASEYAQPVLQYSVWDPETGALKKVGAVPSVLARAAAPAPSAARRAWAS